MDKLNSILFADSDQTDPKPALAESYLAEEASVTLKQDGFLVRLKQTNSDFQPRTFKCSFPLFKK